MSDQFRIVSYREQPELAEKVARFEAESWPKFIEEDAVWLAVTPHFYDEFADFQFFVVDDATSRLVGLCNNVPFNWDGNPDHLPGYHQMLTDGLEDWRAGKTPNTVSGVQVIVDPSYRGQGIPEMIGEELIRLAVEHKMTSIMVAVRPTLKERYPLVSIEEYAHWRRADGELFDPWLRTHERMGGKLVKPEPESTVIEASVAEWEAWTGMAFPVSGEYWLPEGLSTLLIDLEKDLGRHCEPHVWFKFSLD